MAIAIALGLGSAHIPPLLRIAEHGSTAVATVDQVDCETSHLNVSYTFHVGSVRYSFWVRMFLKKCQSVHIGDAALVYYDVTDPAINTMTELGADLKKTIVGIVWTRLLVPPLIILCWTTGRNR